MIDDSLAMFSKEFKKLELLHFSRILEVVGTVFFLNLVGSQQVPNSNGDFVGSHSISFSGWITLLASSGENPWIFAKELARKTGKIQPISRQH